MKTQEKNTMGGSKTILPYPPTSSHYAIARQIAAGAKTIDVAPHKTADAIQLEMGLVEFDIADCLMGKATGSGGLLGLNPQRQWRLIRSALRKRDMAARLAALFDLLDKCA